MTKDELNAADTYHAAEYFIETLKLKIVPIAVGEKDPVNLPGRPSKSWPTNIYELKDFVGQFNIGVLTGQEVDKSAFIADVDIDMKMDDGIRAFPGAAGIVAELLPKSGWVFGRATAPRSHLGYLTTTPVTSIKYKGLKGKCLIELRGLSKKTTCQQSVMHGEHKSGERLQFDVLDPLQFVGTTFDPAGLEAGVKHAAVALAVLQIWPAPGSRHDARLAFSKVLHQARLSDAECLRILTAVNRHTGSDVIDVETCFRDTISKDPKAAIGAKWIIDHLDEGKATLRVIDRILGINRAPEGSFDVTEVDLKTLTPAVWARVHDTNDPVQHCLQGGAPVRVVHLPKADDPDQKRPTWVFQSLDKDKLRNEVAQVAVFVYRTYDRYTEVVPPSDVIRDMLATQPARVPLPSVTRIIYAPIMAPDGTIQLDGGYQPSTGTFYVADPQLTIPAVADRPTDEDVARAVTLINEPLQDFKFETESDRTHAVATLLLPFVRNLIDGPTPLHLFKKSLAGEGATLLSHTLLYPAVGTDIATITTVDADDEWRKTITSTLLDGPMVIFIDNARQLVSPILAKVITDSIWQARILGVSRNAVLPVQCVWVATGINPVLHTELTRRIVPITLNSQTERPWERTGFVITNLREWSRDHRGEMIWAALTLARSWHIAGRQQGARSLGMFESWAAVIGGILQHAGFPGFLANLTDMYDGADVEGDAVNWFYEEWNNHHQDRAVRIADVAMWALALNSPIHELITSQSQKGASTQFSIWVRSLKNRVVTVSGHLLRIEPVKTTGKARSHTWRLASVTAAALPAPAPAEAEIPF